MTPDHLDLGHTLVKECRNNQVGLDNKDIKDHRQSKKKMEKKLPASTVPAITELNSAVATVLLY